MASMNVTAGTRDKDNEQASRPEWASQTMRLDPYTLPHCVSFNREAKDTRTPSAVDVTLDFKGATMRRMLGCGVPLSLALPSRSFQGVAARAFENEDGTTTVTLELMHADPELSIPLCVSDAVEDTAADWHSWSRALNLPMLMVDEQGKTEAVKNAGLSSEQHSQPRRVRHTVVKRRPNFLRRRKMGTVGPMRTLYAREIIART